MILTCPECTTRYRFDDGRVPAGGLAVRCKRCRTVFRASRDSTPVVAPAVQKMTSSPAGAGAPAWNRAPDLKGGASADPSGPVRPPARGPSAIPITVIPPVPAPAEEEIRRLTRIILSDIVIYSPERAQRAIREGRFPELYRSEIEEGRKMVRSRFSSAPAAVETYDRCLRELLEAQRKESQESAGAF